MVKAGGTIIFLGAIFYLLSQSDSDQSNPLALTFKTQEGETIRFSELMDDGQRGLIFFVGTALQCPSCVDIFQAWEQSTSEWSRDKLKVVVVCDGRYIQESYFWEFLRRHEIPWHAVYDSSGSLGKQFRIAIPDQILAVNGGSVTFILPFNDVFWKRVGPSSDLIDELLWGAVGSD